MKRHELKTWVLPFVATCIEESKHHEIRFDDRGYQVGDLLFLREYLKDEGLYTGRAREFEVSYISRGPEWGLPEGVVVMSIEATSELLVDNFPPEQNNPEVTRELLSLAGATVSSEKIAAWTPEERMAADDWASAQCLAPEGERPPIPEHVARDETPKGS